MEPTPTPPSVVHNVGIGISIKHEQRLIVMRDVIP